ncbi:hypothetical protein AB5I41_27625 [Sphingomonas sp. MMS24-JH45]
MTQFFDVGAQVGLWSYTIRYAQANLDGISERTAADSSVRQSLALFGIGRFVGAWLMGTGRAAAAAGRLRGHCNGARDDGGAGRRHAGAVGAGGDELLHVDRIPDDLRARHGRVGPLARGRLADRDGDHRRCGADRGDGRGSDAAGINAAMLVAAAAAFVAVLLFALAMRRTLDRYSPTPRRPCIR